MMKSDVNSFELNYLRQKAEEIVNGRQVKKSLQLSQDEVQELIYELEIEKTQLELMSEELKIVQSSLESTSNKYLELYNFAPLGYFTISDEGEIIELNIRGANMLGSDKPHLRKHKLSEFVSESSGAVFDQFLRNLFVNRTKESCEVAISTEGKPPMYVQLSGSVYENEEQCLITAIDLTERNKAEAALREREERYRTLIENMGEGVGYLDDKETFIFANAAAEKIFGAGECELIGKSLNNFLSGESFEIVKNETAKRIRGKSSVYELKIFRKDGSSRDILVTATPSVDGEKYKGTFGIFRDITERKRLAEALQVSEEKYRVIFENVQDVFYQTNLSGIILEISPSVKYFSEFNRDELIGSPVSSIYDDPDDRAILLNEISKTGELRDYGLRLKTRTGKVRHVSINARIITDSSGTPTHINGAIRDITDRKLAEAEIKMKNEELLKINAEKDKFFSIISHDLRGPFNGFLGLTQILAENLQNLTIKEIQEFSINMRNSASNLFALLENLLEWSKLQRGLISLEPEEFTLSKRVASNVESVRNAFNKKMITINCDIPANLTAIADVPIFNSVMRNILYNALKFTPQGGNVIVTAKAVADNSVEISISDTGIGMNQKIIDNLFRLEKQSNRQGTDGEPSTGLGLVICKDFIEKHGGRIWVDSEEGKGSTFYFTLPGNS
jgi:PAS domain S-box-containing protein